ncbi:MAG: aspartate aminotransferase family protein [Trueperaceae bacterium]
MALMDRAKTILSSFLVGQPSAGQPSIQQPSTPQPLLPIRSGDLLTPERTIDLEIAHGNGDLIKVLNILGIGGPFKIKSPWELEDERGGHLINAGGYAALPLGEMYPPLVAFIQHYLQTNQSVSLPQQGASAWRAALETNLVALLREQDSNHSDSQVFFSNSGAEAVEAALKFAKTSRPKARYILNFSRAYHGKTIGALSLTPNEEYQAPFRPLMPGAYTVPYGDAEALRNAVKTLGAKNIAAIIVEPIQGEGGVILPPTDFLPTIDALCQQHGIISIADEIQTGLGRTGFYFASIALGLKPDIITLAKPLGGGLVAIGATIARKTIYKKMLGGFESKRHSNTFGGNSLAMAVGLKSLELIVEENLADRAAEYGKKGLDKLRVIQQKYPGYIKTVRSAGMLFAMQVRHVVKPSLLLGQSELANQLGTALTMRAMHLHGVHVCFTLNQSQVVRLTPALNIPDDIFNIMFDRVEAAAQNHQHAWKMLPKMPLDRLVNLVKLAMGK